MKDFKKFLLKAFSSKSDVSSKRFIAFLAFIMMAIGFLSNLYFGFKVEEDMYKSMEWIVEIGLGAILLEPLTRKKEDEKPEEPKTPTSGDTQTQTVSSGATQTQTASTGTTQSQSIDMPTGPDPVE